MKILSKKQIEKLGYVNLEETENECYGMINAIFDKKQDVKRKVNDINNVMQILSSIYDNIKKNNNKLKEV